MDEPGDVDWGALFDLHRALAVRMARGLLGARERAEDVVQEAARSVLARARAGEATFASPGHARNYFLRAVHNLAVSELRRRAARPAADLGAEPEPADAAPEPPDAAAERELEELRAGRHAELQLALARLAPEERDLLALRYGDGLAWRAIADRTGAPISTLHSRAEAALGKLRGILGKRAGGAWRKLEDRA